MQKYESKIQRKNIKIKTLNLIKVDLIKVENKEKIKTLELKRCELLAVEFKNQLNLLDLSKEDRPIRNIENKIWKKVLDDYFQDKNNRVLKLNEYENWFSEFKIKLLETQIEGTIFEKRLKALSDIVKTLYRDVSRDKSFLENENIKTDGFEDITLNSFDDEGIEEAINFLDLQNQPSTSGYKSNPTTNLKNKLLQ